MLWIEVIAFQVSVLIVLLVTLFYFIYGLTEERERNEDLILCRDERHIDVSREGRYRDAPIYHLFTQDMVEYGYTNFYDDDPSFLVTWGEQMMAHRRLDYMTKLFKDKEASGPLSFYRIKGTELDAESRKEIEDADILNRAVLRDDELRVHLFMLLISVILITLSSLTVLDDVVIEILEELRTDKFGLQGWQPVYCSYDESEKKFFRILYAPVIMHGLVLVWHLIKNLCKCDPKMVHSDWYIFLAAIAMLTVGEVWRSKIDYNIADERCKSEFSISVMWFRLDYILTLVSFFEQFFDDYVHKTREWFHLQYKCEYLHILAHKKQLTGSEVEMSLADVLQARVTDLQASEKLKDVDMKKSLRLNQPEADRVSKEDILTNMRRARDGYLKGKKLTEIDFVNESETSGQQAYDEFKNNVLSDSVKTLSIGGSIYEHAFWILYHEDSPKIISDTIKQCLLSITLTLVLTYYILTTRGSVISSHIFYGSWQLNIVRTICILMLHLQMQPELKGCRDMIAFAINNTEEFTG